MNKEEKTMSPEDIKAKIQGAVDSCMEKIDRGEYTTIEQAVEAIEKDLEALTGEKENEGEEEGNKMGGLGIGNDKMELPEEEE